MPLHVSIVSVKNYKYIRVYSSYRNEKGQPRSRLIENHGRLDAALLLSFIVVFGPNPSLIWV